MKYLDLLYENGKAPLYISFASSGLNETDELIGVWWGDEKESACMCIEGLTEDILQKTCAYHNISFEAYKCLPSMPKEDFLVMMRRLAQHRNLFSYRLDYVSNMMKSLCGGVPNPPIVVHDLLALLSWQRTGQIISGAMPTLIDIDKDIKKSKFFRKPSVPAIRRQKMIEVDPSRPTPEQNVELLIQVASEIAQEEVLTDQV